MTKVIQQSLIVISLSYILGCASRAPNPEAMDAHTTIKSAMAPALLVDETQKYLEWQKGYNIRVREPALGILVTEWMEDSPLSRHQFSIRVNRDIEGSLLTAHVVVEQFDGQQWKQVLAAPQWEANMIHGLRTYLESKNQAQK